MDTSIGITLSNTVKEYSSEDINSITSELSCEIGFGGSAKVYKGQSGDGLPIAVKVFKEKEAVKETFITEVSIMDNSSHPNIAELKGFCFENEMKAHVCQYMDMGSLDKILYKNNQTMEWVKLYYIAIEIANGLTYLHDRCKQQIVHCDVKPANVLLDSNFPTKITDFGVTKLVNRDLGHFIVTNVRVTRGYAAPEILELQREVTCKCDVFSFGIMLFDILRNRRNQERTYKLDEHVWEKFENEQLDEFITDCDIGEDNRRRAKILSMVGFWCIQFIPDMRPSMRDVANMLEKEILVITPPNPFFPSKEMRELTKNEKNPSTPFPSMRPADTESGAC